MRILLALCMLSLTAHAALEWETQSITLQVHPTQVCADAVYRFSNTGQEPVTINETKVSCGCLAPKLTKRTFQPGESGELTIKFDLRNRSGKQKKSTVVSMSDGKTVTLAMSVDIPKAYNIAPIMMKWVKGATNETKTAKLENPNKQPIKILSATSSHRDLPVELKTIREGFEYEVVVTKKPSAFNARSVVRLQTEPPPGLKEAKILKFYVHAQ